MAKAKKASQNEAVANTAMIHTQQEHDHKHSARPEASSTGAIKGISLYDPNFLSQADVDRLFAALEKLPWKRHTMKMYGKEIPMPRLYQWFGITPCIYGETITPHEWTPETLEIQERVHKATGVLFDSLNVNYYRPGGTDHLGWHSDDTKEGLWDFPIASVSLGAVRSFQTCPYNGNGKWKRRFHKHFGKPDQPVALEHGSLVVMPAGSQEFYVHRLRKATKQQGTGARINLTFRMMTPMNAGTVDRGDTFALAVPFDDEQEPLLCGIENCNNRIDTFDRVANDATLEDGTETQVCSVCLLELQRAYEEKEAGE